VQKALSKAQGLFERWEELLQEETPVSRDELFKYQNDDTLVDRMLHEYCVP